MSERPYAEGGYVGGPSYAPVTGWHRLHPEECVIAKRGDKFVCVRDHDHGGKR